VEFQEEEAVLLAKV